MQPRQVVRLMRVSSRVVRSGMHIINVIVISPLILIIIKSPHLILIDYIDYIDYLFTCSQR